MAFLYQRLCTVRLKDVELHTEGPGGNHVEVQNPSSPPYPHHANAW